MSGDFLSYVVEILSEYGKSMTAKEITGELAQRFAYPPTALGLARKLGEDDRFVMAGRTKDYVKLWALSGRP